MVEICVQMDHNFDELKTSKFFLRICLAMILTISSKLSSVRDGQKIPKGESKS